MRRDGEVSEDVLLERERARRRRARRRRTHLDDDAHSVPNPAAAQVSARRAPERRALERVAQVPSRRRLPPDGAVRVPPAWRRPTRRRELEALARLPAVRAAVPLPAEGGAGRARVALVVEAARSEAVRSGTRARKERKAGGDALVAVLARAGALPRRRRNARVDPALRRPVRRAVDARGELERRRREPPADLAAADDGDLLRRRLPARAARPRRRRGPADCAADEEEA